MDSSSQRLDGWKAIAAYLGRDERTAQRWRQRGLPVHLVPGGKRGTVFAYAHEIDDWLSKQTPADVRQELTRANGREETLLSIPVGNHPTESRHHRLRPAWAAALAFGAGALVALAFALANGSRPGAATQVVRAEVTSAGLVAWTAAGEVAFSIPARDLIPPDVGSSAVPMVSADKDPIVADFNGDGSPQVVAILMFRVQDRVVTSHAVVSYSQDGALQWRYQPHRRLRFGGRDFEGPWRITSRLVTRDDDGRVRLFLTVIHDVWWPSFVVSLDASGKERLHHVNSGHLYHLQRLHTSQGERVLVSGVNNEHKAAVMVAIDPDGPPTISPQVNSVFTCEDCTQGWPVKYLLFPQAELGFVANRPYNLGDRISVSNADVRVSTIELGPEHSALSHYRLSRALDVESFGMSDAYWEFHRQHEAKGQIDHAAAECPDGLRREISVWSAEGWQPVLVDSESPPAE